MKNIIDKMNKNKILVITFGVLVLVGIFILSNTLAAPIPVKSVEILSEKLNYNEKEAGSWKIDKSAKWTGKGEAEITFDIDTNIMDKNNNLDVLFVIDISSSMLGDKLDRVKADSVELLNYLFKNNRNRAALITFGTGAEILSNFTNNKDDLITKINDLDALEITNYYQALLKVEDLLKNYTKENGKECVVLFLTDGYPNKDTPNEIGQYHYLKKKYPYVRINGIQYEMGDTILGPIKTISDNQYVANIKTLKNILFVASETSVSYDNFKVEDYIDTNYFCVEKADDIKVDYGNVSFDKNTQKITWNLDKLRSGQILKMTIKVKLKEELVGEGGVYPTNEKEIINSTINGVSEKIESTKTPILADNYKVVYDGNAPEGCTISNVPATRNISVYDTVEVSDNAPKCNGYLFKGWKIITDDVEKLNGDYFVMPEKDVIIRAVWSKIYFRKSMNGTVDDGITLYEQVQFDFQEGSKYVKKYDGDTSTFSGDKDVYYYYGSASNNNVIFANYCWKIVRTTDTGGVKLLYNGVPTTDGKCNNTKEATMLTAEQMNTSSSTVMYSQTNSSLSDVGYMFDSKYAMTVIDTKKIPSGSIYGSSFTYENGNYTLNDTSTSFIGRHYTCFNKTGVCSEISYIYQSVRWISSPSYTNIHYINLINGESVADALNNMLYSSEVNKYDSTIKSVIDYWYSYNMTEYTSYLEDTIWCNDRTIGTIQGWVPNGELNGSLLFKPSTDTGYLTCTNKTDRFTVSPENGNGALKYPVGLVTWPEIIMARSDTSKAIPSPLYGGSNIWTMTPRYIFSFGSGVFWDTNNGSGQTVSSTMGVRPSISLRAGIHYADGNGSANTPYLVDEKPIKYNIHVQENSNIKSIPTTAGAGRVIELIPNDENYAVKSFKVNGNLVKGNALVMPKENAEITEVEFEKVTIIESEHYPYPKNLNETVEKTFEGATFLSVKLEYQLYSTSDNYIYAFDRAGKRYGKYGGGGSYILKDRLIIPGNYIKLNFVTNNTNNPAWYGYKVSIVPNYD